MTTASSAHVRGNFGLLELATSLALLVIVMGLTVSLARYVRATSAEQITRRLLRQLNDAISTRVASDDPMQSAPEPPPFQASETEWVEYARRSATIVSGLCGNNEFTTDAWGNPIGYLASQRTQIGMAPYDRPFCFSAGPDGRYLTRDDNLYSYEQLSLQAPTTQPTGGHSE